MATVSDASDTFKLDKLTREILHDLVERAQDDTLTWDAVVFRRDYGKHLTLIDQLVANGFIVHNSEYNTYRLHLPFLRLLEGVFVSHLIGDLNSLMGACRNHYKTWFDDPITINRLSGKSDLGIKRSKSMARYLHWAGLLTIPRGPLDGDSNLRVNEYILEPSSIEDWMDRQLAEFDTNRNNLAADPGIDGSLQYSTPLLSLLHETIRKFYSGRERTAHPEKTELIDWLQGQTTVDVKVNKNIAEVIHQLLKAPERRKPAEISATGQKKKTSVKKKPLAKKKTTAVEPIQTIVSVASDQLVPSAINTGEPETQAAPEIAGKTAARKKPTAKKFSAKKVATRKVASKKKSSAKKSTAVKKVPAKKALASKAVVEATATETAVTEKIAAEEVVAKKTAAKKTVTKKIAVKKTAAKKTAAKRTAAKKTAAKRTAAKKTAAKKTAARKTVAKKTAARKTVAEKITAMKINDEEASVEDNPVNDS